MRCHSCLGTTEISDSREVTSRAGVPGQRRRHRCKSCGQRFTTIEQVVVDDLDVVKRGGAVVKFDRNRLRKGIKKASAIEELPETTLNALVDKIVMAMPVASRLTTVELGELVLHEMDLSSAVTDVARARYAMVFYGKAASAKRRSGLAAFLIWLQENYPERKPLEVHTGPPAKVIKNGGDVEDFDHRKLERSIGIESKARGKDDDKTAEFARRLANEVVLALDGQRVVSSMQIAGEVLGQLRDEPDRALAYLRYVSAVKHFKDIDDVWHEALALQQKAL